MKTFFLLILSRNENVQKKYFLPNVAMLNCLSKNQLAIKCSNCCNLGSRVCCYIELLT